MENGERLSSEDDGTPNMGFTVLSLKQRKQLDLDADALRNIHLPTDQERYLLSRLYASFGVMKDMDRGCFAEAIEYICAIPDPQRNSVLWRALGELYVNVGARTEAESAL